MGHEINYITRDEDCNRKAVPEEIYEYAGRNGDGYSGSVKWHDNVAPLEDADAAQKWISDHDNGWYDDHAVRFYDYMDVMSNEKMKMLQKKIHELGRKKEIFANENTVANLKSCKYIGCQECGSKLARTYLHSNYCPVCRHDLRSATVLRKLREFDEKREFLTLKYLEEKKKVCPRVVKWMIKFEYHC